MYDIAQKGKGNGKSHNQLAIGAVMLGFHLFQWAQHVISSPFAV